MMYPWQHDHSSFEYREWMDSIKVADCWAARIVDWLALKLDVSDRKRLKGLGWQERTYGLGRNKEHTDSWYDPFGTPRNYAACHAIVIHKHRMNEVRRKHERARRAREARTH